MILERMPGGNFNRFRYLLVFYLIIYNAVIFQLLQTHPVPDQHLVKLKTLQIGNFIPVEKSTRVHHVLKDRENNQIVIKNVFQYCKAIIFNHNLPDTFIIAENVFYPYYFYTSRNYTNSLTPRSPPFQLS
jgi:hypothetical protein